MFSLRILSRDNRCEMFGKALTSGKEMHRDSESYPCFRAAFAFMDGNGSQLYEFTYKLHIRKDTRGIYNNFSVLQKKDMCKLLNAFKYVIPFTYHFEESADYLIVVLHLSGTRLQHKALLMFSRSLFEYPHNVCGCDALKLRKIKDRNGINYSKMSLVDLYILCLTAHDFSVDESIIHSSTPVYISQSVLKTRLQRLNGRKISSVYKYNDRQFRKLEMRRYNEIFDNEAFEKRVGYYETNLKASLYAKSYLLSVLFNGHRVQLD